MSMPFANAEINCSCEIRGVGDDIVCSPQIGYTVIILRLPVIYTKKFTLGALNQQSSAAGRRRETSETFHGSAMCVEV